MKYSASITILNDQGESVFERELTQDEIIDELLKRPQPAEKEDEPDMVIAGVPVHVTPVAPKQAKKPRGGGVNQRKKGSQRARAAIAGSRDT